MNLDMGVTIALADGDKCDRCWKILPELAKAKVIISFVVDVMMSFPARCFGAAIFG